MANILVSGLINTETTVRVRQFPVSYYPIDYPFFGVNTAVSGVAYNISKALKTLGDDVTLVTMTGRDFPAEYIQSQLRAAGIGTDWVRPGLKETPNSVVLYDGEGKRQIYCDLKDIQETPYDFPEDICRDADVVAASKAAGFDNLRGHKSVGGLRASIYNAMPKEGVEALVEFLKKYEAEHA